MRFVILALCALPCSLPCAALADSFTLNSRIDDVTVYPEGSKITRSAPFSIPAGTHQLNLSDLPVSIDPHAVRVWVDGAIMGSVTIGEGRGDTKSPDVLIVEAKIEDLRRQIQAVQDKAAQALLFADAAQAQISFLGQIGTSKGIGTAEIDRLRSIARMIGEEALIAQQSQHAARIEARDVERDLKDLQDDLQDAEQVLQNLNPRDREHVHLSVSVETPEATEGQLTLTYYSEEAVWVPVYDMYLTRGSAASLIIERGAIVRQFTGETWHDVNLTLSTIAPFSQIEPGGLYPRRRFVEKPAPVIELPEGNYGSLAEPALASPIIVSQTQNDGYAVVYTYPTPVTITTNVDQIRLSLDTLATGADVSAKAIPSRDDTAFLVANIVNDSGEVILPSLQVSLFVDDVFVGISDLSEAIPAGGTAELPFGPIEGLRLERVVLNQNEGDRGIISRSNEQTKTIQIKVSNLTNDTWPVRLLDQVPYSEQEDLQISWTADPEVTDQSVDNERGILGWDLVLNPGEVRMLRLDQTLSWPEGMELR